MESPVGQFLHYLEWNTFHVFINLFRLFLVEFALTYFCPLLDSKWMIPM